MISSAMLIPKGATFTGALWGIAVFTVVIFLTGFPLAYYAARYNLDLDLITRGSGFGYYGSVVSNVIFATFTLVLMVIPFVYLLVSHPETVGSFFANQGETGLGATNLGSIMLAAGVCSPPLPGVLRVLAGMKRTGLQPGSSPWRPTSYSTSTC